MNPSSSAQSVEGAPAVHGGHEGDSVGSMESDSTAQWVRLAGAAARARLDSVVLSYGGPRQTSLSRVQPVALGSAAEPYFHSDSSASTGDGLIMRDRQRRALVERQPGDMFGAELLGTRVDGSLRYDRREVTLPSDSASVIRSFWMAAGEHPAQLRRRALERKRRIFAIRVRFIGVTCRLLRQLAVERALAPFLEDLGLDESMVAWLLTWHRGRDRPNEK